MDELLKEFLTEAAENLLPIAAEGLLGQTVDAELSKPCRGTA